MPKLLLTDDGTYDDRAAAARRQMMENAARRSAEDPTRLARSLRTVRAAIDTGRLELADVEAFLTGSGR